MSVSSGVSICSRAEPLLYRCLSTHCRYYAALSLPLSLSAEQRCARSAVMPDRVRYNPKKDGLAVWKPTKRLEGCFSTPPSDTHYVTSKEAARMDELMTKFGLGPGGTGQMADAADVVGLEGEVD